VCSPCGCSADNAEPGTQHTRGARRPIRLYAAEQRELQCFLGAAARGQAAYETLAMWHAGYLGVGVLALCACLCFALALFASAVRSMQASVGGLMTALLFAAYTLVYVQHLLEQVTLLWQGLELTQPLWEVLNMAALHDPLADILEVSPLYPLYPPPP